MGYLLLIGSQASAAAEHTPFVDFSRRWDSLVFGKLCHSDWLCGLKSLPQNHAALRIWGWLEGYSKLWPVYRLGSGDLLSQRYLGPSYHVLNFDFAWFLFHTPKVSGFLIMVEDTPEQYCFFTIHTIFHDISIWCNISRYFHDIFQALNWSKKCVISSKCCPGSIHVEILQQKRRILCFCDKNDQIYAFLQKKLPHLKCKVWC